MASKKWSVTLDKFVSNLGFVRCRAGPILDTLIGDIYFVIHLDYVDDILTLLLNRQVGIEDLVVKFLEMYEIRVHRKTGKYLGMSIFNEGNKEYLHNEPMVERVLKHFDISGCRPAATPLPEGLNLRMEEKSSTE